MKELKIGDKAPEFSQVNQNGDVVTLSGLKGKKVILYFYPKDNTPGCTAQACNLRDNEKQLSGGNYTVIGVSADSEKSHQKFIDKHDLNFDLLADTDKSVINAYGVWGPKQFMGKKYDGIHRMTYIINEEGIIEDIIKKVKTKAHTEQILS